MKTLFRGLLLALVLLLAATRATDFAFYCEELTCSFISSLTTAQLWDFGDGWSALDQNPVHTYDEYGIYTVTLTTSSGVTSHDVTLVPFVCVRRGPKCRGGHE